MDVHSRERTDSYIHARHQHPAWMLLASRRGPLVLSCLQTLFEEGHASIPFEAALLSLTEILADHANHPEFDIGASDCTALARRELREWIRRALIVEREGRIYATDALEEALRFVDSLGERVMTSTASRLSVVQREIENVEGRLNPDPKSRATRLRRQMAELEQQLAAVQAGDVEVLAGPEAVERIREIFNLAISLRADFRRVEDSWRDADRAMRQSIVSGEHHRGAVVDKLLDGHDVLLNTPEGRVFHGFHQQLSRKIELDDMRIRLRTILKHPLAEAALNPQQHQDLRWLVLRLVKESEAVIEARARIERDVQGFLKTGLAAEHHRVGMLLNELFRCALGMDWGSAALRSRLSPLPPSAPANGNLPLAERIRFKSIDADAPQSLELTPQVANLEDIGEETWRSFAGLDRHALVRDTLALLAASGETFRISGLARHLPPTHDLETIALWLTMAREAGLPLGSGALPRGDGTSPSNGSAREFVDVACADGTELRFDVPVIELNAAAIGAGDWEM